MRLARKKQPLKVESEAAFPSCEVGGWLTMIDGSRLLHHRYCLLGAPSWTLASAFSGAGAILTAGGTTRSRNQKTTTWFTIKSGTYTVRINQATPTWKDGKPTTTPLYMANNRSANPTMLSSQTSGRANPGRSRSTRAVSKAKTAVKTSPYAAGTAKSDGRVPPITCGSRNTKPSVRNTLSRTNGSNACTYGCFDKRGTTYREAISVKESRLTVALTRNARNARFIDVLLDRCNYT